MFFSKLWMVLVTFAGILALGALLVATRPAEYFLRQSYRGDGMLIDMAQVAFDAELSRDARAVLDRMGSIRLDKRIVEAAENRKDTEKVIPVLQAFAKQVGFMELILSDPTGAVLANSAKGRSSVAGFTPFKEAVQGFHSDNTTILDNQLVQVFAVPVLSKDYKKVAGVLVGLRKFDTDFLAAVQDQLGHSRSDDFDVEIAIFMNNELKYTTAKHDVWAQVPAYYKKVASDVQNPEKGFSPSVTLVDKNQEYQVILGQLRGAVTNPLLEPTADKGKPQETKEKTQEKPADPQGTGQKPEVQKAKKGINSGIEDDSGVYYAIAWKLPPQLGSFAFMDKRIPQDELMRGFPWGMLAGIGFGIFILGMLIIVFEGDLPLRRLIRRTREVAAGDILLINDQEFHGRFSSLARAINEAIEKTVERGGGTSLQDKSISDILGGSAPSSASGPGLKDGGPPPPPVSGKPLSYPKVRDVALPGQKLPVQLPEKPVLSAVVPPIPTGAAPPPLPGKPVAAAAKADSAPASGKPSGNILLPPAPNEDPREYFQQVLQQFKELRQKLEGSLDGFDEADFLLKLERSTADVREKMKCERVILTVYEREGKAGLKAAPYRGQ